MDFDSASFDSVSSTYMVTGEFHMRGVRLCVVVVMLDYVYDLMYICMLSDVDMLL